MVARFKKSILPLFFIADFDRFKTHVYVTNTPANHA